MTTHTVSAIDCHVDQVDAALYLARAFGAGRRLAVSAPSCPDHAHHITVEFVHPVVAGALPLPAVVVDRTSSIRSSNADVRLLVGLESDELDPATDLIIDAALTDEEIMRTYHVLWELVQVCLEHPGLVGLEPARGGDSTGFLYPFLDSAESDEAGLRASLVGSAEAKRAQSAATAAAAIAANRAGLDTAAQTIAATADAGGRVLVMGNGGSASDAARVVRLLAGLGIDACSLASDYAVFSALANDIGAAAVFARQVEAFGRAGDVLIGCSTSGSSANLLRGFERARSLGMATIAISGYGGAALAADGHVDVCLAVDSESVHRIQEAEAALIAALCHRLNTGAEPGVEPV